jgi:hypothetical protein
MEYYLPLQIFRDEDSRFFPNCPIPENGRCPVGLLRETGLLTGREPSTLRILN